MERNQKIETSTEMNQFQVKSSLQLAYQTSPLNSSLVNYSTDTVSQSFVWNKGRKGSHIL